MLCLVEIGPAVLEKKIFKIRQRILLFRSYLPLEKAWFFHWTNLMLYFVLSLVEIGLAVLAKKIFKFRQCIFAISWLSPLIKGHGPSFENTWIPITQNCFVTSFVEIPLNPLTQNCFVPSLVEIGSVILEKKIFKFCQCIFVISKLSPLGKGHGPAFEQTLIPIT